MLVRILYMDTDTTVSYDNVKRSVETDNGSVHLYLGDEEKIELLIPLRNVRYMLFTDHAEPKGGRYDRS